MPAARTGRTLFATPTENPHHAQRLYLPGYQTWTPSSTSSSKNFVGKYLVLKFVADVITGLWRSYVMHIFCPLHVQLTAGVTLLKQGNNSSDSTGHCWCGQGPGSRWTTNPGLTYLSRRILLPLELQSIYCTFFFHISRMCSNHAAAMFKRYVGSGPLILIAAPR